MSRPANAPPDALARATPRCAPPWSRPPGRRPAPAPLTGKRAVMGAAGIRLYDGVSGTPVVDLNATTGSATFRGTVEGALIRTSGAGQRMEIESSGTAGGRTISYPASGTGVASFTRRDDTNGNAEVRMDARGINRGVPQLPQPVRRHRLLGRDRGH